MADPIALIDQLIERASRSPDPAITVLSVLRTLSTYLHYEGRDENPETEPDLFRIRAAGGGRWLDGLANTIELDSSITHILDESLPP